MTPNFQKGDKVEWKTGNATTTGTIEKQITKPTDLDGNHVTASEKDPRYLVKNDNTGHVTGHKPETLKRCDEAESKSSKKSSSHQKKSQKNSSNSDDKFDSGEQVEWNTAQGKTTGKIEHKLTESTKIKSQKIKATEENPKYLVNSDKTGKKAAHKPNALSRVDEENNSSNSTKKSNTNDEREQQIKAFQEVVNMTATELEKWLDTEESQSVGQKEDDGEAIGHKSGKRIVELLRKKKADYTEDDLNHMSRVVSYVRRHSAQKPSGDIENTNWRYSLMNWGNDPLK